MAETGYAKIEKALKLDKLAFVDDIVVTIRRNGDVINELLSPGQMQGSWEWLKDWWEGEEDVQFIGARYLGDCSCFGNHLEYNNGGDKQRWP